MPLLSEILSSPQHTAAADIVMSSRIRLARNIKDTPFPGWLQKETRTTVCEKIHSAVDSTAEMTDSFLSKGMDKFSLLEKQILVEQHLISREHAAKNFGSSVSINREKNLSIMINEEDHLRLQAFGASFCLLETWNRIDQVDSEIEQKLDYAFSQKLGYLTACPTNVGTGMRASAMMHLPGLVLDDHIQEVMKAVGHIGLVVRGLYGEGTEALGNLFQISNQMTLGESEQKILERLHKIVSNIIEHEFNARLKLMCEKPRLLADQLARAYGILKYSHAITSKEALNLLSLMRMGVDLHLVPDDHKSSIDELFILTQPAHLQKSAERKLNAEERDSFRADLLREALNSIAEPDVGRLY